MTHTTVESDHTKTFRTESKSYFPGTRNFDLIGASSTLHLLNFLF